jgi:hypothetical protein
VAGLLIQALGTSGEAEFCRSRKASAHNFDVPLPHHQRPLFIEKYTKLPIMPKTPTSPDARQARRHNPLTEEYVPSHPFKQKSAKRKKLSKEDRDEEHFIDSKASRKILKIGQELADEDQEEANARRNSQRPLVNPTFAFDSRFGEDEVEEDELEEYDDDEAWGNEEEIVEEVVSLSISTYSEQPTYTFFTGNRSQRP